MAALSLAGLFISLYLYLHKLGFIGELACGAGGCETVQLSRYSRFLGLDVPLIGVLGYLVLLVLSVLSLQRPAERRWAVLLLWLSGVALAFSLYLTGIELFVLRAICRWCMGSASIIVLCFIAAWAGRPRPDTSPT